LKGERRDEDNTVLIGRHLDLMTSTALEDEDKFPPELEAMDTAGEIRIDKNKIIEPIAIYLKSLFKKPKQILVYRRGMRNIFCIDDDVRTSLSDSTNAFTNIPSMGFFQENRQLSLHYEFCVFRFNFAYIIGKSLRSKSAGNELNSKFGISSTVARLFFEELSPFSFIGDSIEASQTEHLIFRNICFAKVRPYKS
jgi:hypothetical protein